MSRHSKGRLLRWLQGARGVPWGADPSDFDPHAVEQTLRSLGLLFGEVGGPRRYFPLDAQGLDRIGPAPRLIVSNHSGGTTVLDTIGFLCAWYWRFGTGRPIHPLAHEMILSTGALGRWVAAQGILRASRPLALRVLAQLGHDVMVMPGGDVETWRPYRKRYQVDFAGRRGYASLAIQAGVPIVPVAHAGAHSTLLVLSDGRWLAHKIGLQRWARASVWPVHLSLPWGLGFGPMPHLPIPKTFRYRIGKPIYPPRGLPFAEKVLVLDARVRAAIQDMLDELAGRPARAPTAADLRLRGLDIERSVDRVAAPYAGQIIPADPEALGPALGELDDTLAEDGLAVG